MLMQKNLGLSKKKSACLIVLIFVLVFQLSQYNESGLIENITVGMGMLKNSVYRNVLIFPSRFPVPDIQQYIKSEPKHINMTELGGPRAILAKQEDQSIIQLNTKYVDHNLTIFDSSKNIEVSLSNCNSLLRHEATVKISQAYSLEVSITDILIDFINEIPNNPYFRELAPFFLDDLMDQIRDKTVNHYWYRLAGSSVWLEEYGVHYMISRVLYSPKGSRNQPVISLTYAQLYDKYWRELKGAKLMLPTGVIRKEGKYEKDFENLEYKVTKFPSFLPIPFWHDYDAVQDRYYGPEDPRIILIKNKLGYDEPLVVFNLFHRKFVLFDDDNDGMVTKADFFRSMFLCWPWQYQKGKENTDGKQNSEYDSKDYIRIAELSLEGVGRMKKQKNWSPFISASARSKEGYDSHINFVYRWTDLEVFKCDLEKEVGLCSYIYKMVDNLSPEAQVGPLRGGTQLINLNEVIKSNTDLDLSGLFPKGREIMLGFARAHLKECGCATSFYRPNLVILVKDSIPSDNINSPDNFQDIYKVSHLSSSVSFDVPIIGWDLNVPWEVCVGANVLLPNGISSMTIKSFEQDTKSGLWISEDYTTITLSISDFTVHTLHIKGLLNEILNLSDGSLFIAGSENTSDGKPLDSYDQNAIADSLKVGFNNDNVACALDNSKEFCRIYGIETQLFKEISDQDDRDDGLEEGEVDNDY